METLITAKITSEKHMQLLIFNNELVNKKIFFTAALAEQKARSDLQQVIHKTHKYAWKHFVLVDLIEWNHC